MSSKSIREGIRSTSRHFAQDSEIGSRFDYAEGGDYPIKSSLLFATIVQGK
jgi:hypothetical protein